MALAGRICTEKDIILVINVLDTVIPPKICPRQSAQDRTLPRLLEVEPSQILDGPPSYDNGARHRKSCDRRRYHGIIRLSKKNGGIEQYFR